MWAETETGQFVADDWDSAAASFSTGASEPVPELRLPPRVYDAVIGAWSGHARPHASRQRLPHYLSQ
jgi:hypothetical protein